MVGHAQETQQFVYKGEARPGECPTGGFHVWRWFETLQQCIMCGSVNREKPWRDQITIDDARAQRAFFSSEKR